MELTNYKPDGKGGRTFTITAMNDRCEVVGWRGKGIFLWRDEQRFDLNDLIPAKTGWDLVIVKDINESSQIIGHGKINGYWHAFLLTPISQPAKP